ncbi:MAG: hypothetical protein KDA35_08955 [Hyphomonadaceae bacterium]|nr:hypothetical protein [Hyphomonadaceae bacterium]
MTYWIAGGVIASSILLIAVLLTMGQFAALTDALADCLEYLGVALPTGIATAGIAWLIRRPDRDAPNPDTSPP